MDFGIAGRQAVICAASSGLGFACAAALAAEGVNITINARQEDKLYEAICRLKDINSKVQVTGIAGDISCLEVQLAILAVTPVVDILVTNAGGPPIGYDTDWTREIWLTAIETNMLTPIALIQAVLEKMKNRRFGRIVNITSGSIKAPRNSLSLSNAARGGLTTYISGLAKSSELAGKNVTINNLLPGAFATQRLIQTFANEASLCGKLAENIAIERINTIPARRLGAPEEFGAYCAFLCSANAGYITGQNILIDGGAFSGVF
ncbi:SDR family oxidoreductase [Enterobacter hormaechei]|uniref:SDR family oxidoreductase n=1 Tax=Enterobacter hormaechei TaxID=158836 RepID=UPI00277B9124|nr:SDR family oxidoreductase [Enterobacter hormaechei]MDY3571624.1 SDR family oxidoreductase [Enterobacter hormaechei]HDS5592962.1 SDR family oxidoreductase [Enterobacter hormaechei subsp. xiangfangensis]